MTYASNLILELVVKYIEPEEYYWELFNLIVNERTLVIIKRHLLEIKLNHTHSDIIYSPFLDEHLLTLNGCGGEIVETIDGYEVALLFNGFRNFGLDTDNVEIAVAAYFSVNSMSLKWSGSVLSKDLWIYRKLLEDKI